MRLFELLTLCVLACSPARAAETTLIHAGRLIEPVTATVQTDQLITVRDGKIVSVAPYHPVADGTPVLDWTTFTVLPGLIDLHTHLIGDIQSADPMAPVNASEAEDVLHGAANARKTLEAGFTTVRDVGCYRGLTDVALRDAINQGLVAGPRMFVAGAYLTRPGGGGEVIGGDKAESLPPEFRMGVGASPEKLAERAEYLLAHGADFLKMIATGAVLTTGTEPGEIELSGAMIRAVTAVASAHKTHATAHAHGADGIKIAIKAGVRSIEHASLIDDEGIALAKAAGVWLVMDVYDGDYIDMIGRRDGWPEETLRKNRETTDLQRAGFRKAVKAGVRMGFGTDSGIFPHGENARQFAYMVRYGMTPMQAIQSATSSAALLLDRADELGSLLPGHAADLIAVSGDPLQDITVLEHVAGVVKAGKQVR